MCIVCSESFALVCWLSQANSHALATTPHLTEADGGLEESSMRDSTEDLSDSQSQCSTLSLEEKLPKKDKISSAKKRKKQLTIK